MSTSMVTTLEIASRPSTARRIDSPLRKRADTPRKRLPEQLVVGCSCGALVRRSMAGGGLGTSAAGERWTTLGSDDRSSPPKRVEPNGLLVNECLQALKRQ